ncbi:MAG: vanadium-dependent haloperoxidase [Pseudomonadota bacterium]
MQKKHAVDHIDALHSHDERTHALSRRAFVRNVGLATVAGCAAVGSPAGALETRDRRGNALLDAPGEARARSREAFDRRVEAAQQQRALPEPRWPKNGDEADLTGFLGNFSKTLPHNDVGEVDGAAYEQLLNALDSGAATDFDAIPAGGTGVLANPRAAYSFALSGADSHKIDLPAVHGFSSARQAAEAAEVYWMALCRDVPFAQYDTHPLTLAAAEDLSTFSDFTAPRDTTAVSPATLFRGQTPGDLQGPYLSTFLTRDIPYGNRAAPQAFSNPVAGDDHMTDVAAWLAVQRGQFPATPNALQLSLAPLTTGRDLAEYVHTDYSYQAYLNAALICLGFGDDARAPHPYRTAQREAGFVTFGGPAVLDVVARAARVALRPAWVHKWLVHRKLRPEAYGGRVEHLRLGVRDYPIHTELLNSNALARTFSLQGNHLLSQAYPEGSPTHPSYPAGHATMAGACVTVLKAFFNESFEIPGSGGLTVGGELNKLASNIALGRNLGGVHWRADGDDGLLAGEQIAITLLRDELVTVTESVESGFTLTRFEGDLLTIS